MTPPVTSFSKWDRDGYRARVTHLATQVDELRAGGSRVETIFLDGDSLTAFGVRLYIPNWQTAVSCYVA